MRSTLLFAALAALAAACAHSTPKPAPAAPVHTITCDQVATKLLELSVADAMAATKAANPTADDEQLAGAQKKLEEQAAAQHDDAVHQCEQRDTAEADRQCVLAAGTLADAKACSQTAP